MRPVAALFQAIDPLFAKQTGDRKPGIFVEFSDLLKSEVGVGVGIFVGRQVVLLEVCCLCK